MSNETNKCELCGESMPQGETMFKFHGYSGPCPKPPLTKPSEKSDPNGKMSIPFGKEEDFNFGYEIGFQEAWGIMNKAIQGEAKCI